MTIDLEEFREAAKKSPRWLLDLLRIVLEKEIDRAMLEVDLIDRTDSPGTDYTVKKVLALQRKQLLEGHLTVIKEELQEKGEEEKGEEGKE